MTMTAFQIATILARIGFNPGPIDGIRGPQTDAAIVAFKRSIGFNPRPYRCPPKAGVEGLSVPRSIRRGTLSRFI